MSLRYLRTLFIWVFSISFLAINQAEGSSKELNENASTLYRDARYGEALDIWYQLARSGNTDPNLYFNIGSAEALSGHIPESILAFEKALRFRPADKEIREAIKKERGKMENAVIPVASFFLIDWYKIGLTFLRPGGWTFGGLIFLIVFVIQWLMHVKAIKAVGRPGIKNNWIFLAAGVSFMLIGFLSYHQLHRKNEAIVMAYCDCRQAPALESPLTRKLEAGEKVRITDQVADWNKVSLLNLDEGWVKKECLRVIDVGK